MLKNLIGLDASTDVCTVAVQSSVGTFEEQITAKQQTEMVLPVLHKLLARAQLDWASCHALVLGVGPGRFTGNRVVSGIVQGLAMACALPIVTVSSLHLLALTAQQHWPNAKRILVVNNAFMGEVYAAHFVVQHGDICALGEEQIMQPESLTAEIGSSYVAVGDAWAAYPKQLAKLAHQIPVVDDRLRPAASSAFAFAGRQIDAGNTCSHSTLKLAYLRHSGAWRKA